MLKTKLDKNVDELGVIRCAHGFGIGDASLGCVVLAGVFEAIVQADFHTDAEEDAARAEEEGKKRLEHKAHEPQRWLREETK